jgi:hypothetical protein
MKRIAVARWALFLLLLVSWAVPALAQVRLNVPQIQDVAAEAVTLALNEEAEPLVALLPPDAALLAFSQYQTRLNHKLTQPEVYAQMRAMVDGMRQDPQHMVDEFWDDWREDFDWGRFTFNSTPELPADRTELSPEWVMVSVDIPYQYDGQSDAFRVWVVTDGSQSYLMGNPSW